MEVFWFYLDGARRRQGPVDAQQVRGALHNGEISVDSLIWREGMEAWKPLRDVAEFSDFAKAFIPADGASASHGGTLPPRATAPVMHYEPVYAGFWRRWAALCLDQLMIMVPLIGLTLLFGYMGGAFRNLARDGMPKIDGLYYFLYFLISPLYFALQESGPHQATLGKRALGIKVTDTDGKPLGFPHALGRWLAASLSYLTLYLGFLMAAFTSEKKALHDVVAKTLVVDRWAFTAHPERQQQGMSGCLMVFVAAVVLAIPAMGILAAIALPAYKQYATRAGGPLAQMMALRGEVERIYEEEGRCPVNGEDGIGIPQDYRSDFIDRIEVGQSQPGRCGMMIFMREPQGRTADGYLLMEYQPASDAWQCSNHGLSDTAAPTSCR